MRSGSYLLSAIVSTFLIACGGGGDSSPATVAPIAGVTTITPAVADMSDCYRINLGNSLRATVTPSVDSAQFVGANTAANRTIYYNYATYDRTYANATFGGAAVTARSEVGTGTVPSLSSFTPSPYKVETFFNVTATTFTNQGSLSYDSTGTVANIATNTGDIQNLTLLPGQSQTYSSTTTNSNFTPTTAVRTVTYTFVGREDVVTAAGMTCPQDQLRIDSESGDAIVLDCEVDALCAACCT